MMLPELNQIAIECLEKLDYENALEYFQKAVNESRNVQSLNNLAWMYYNEEEEEVKAIELLKEALSFHPTSHFPYSLLGQIYTQLEQWHLASEILQKSISRHPSKEAYNNLAVAKYHLGELEEAAELFRLVAGDSDYQLYSYVNCLIELNRKDEAKQILDTFNADADDFVGDLSVADLYLEMNNFVKAVEWFERGWNTYWKDPEWGKSFVYALSKTNNVDRINEVISESIRLKEEEINDSYEDEINANWTKEDHEDYLLRLLKEKEAYESIRQDIESGYIPKIKFVTSLSGACYLFGCNRHQHPEYEEN
jgi:tetratricopeptide (TPR) repeat protein